MKNKIKRKTNIVKKNILLYKFVDGFLEKRFPYRKEHLKLVESFKKNNDLISAGAYGDPLEGGLVIFCCSIDRVKEFVDSDPYHKNNLITEYSIYPWMVVS